MRRLALALSLAALVAGPAAAENPKLRIDGDTLIYDTEIDPEIYADGRADIAAEIAEADVDAMLGLLRANPGIGTLELNSGGGIVWAAQRIGEIVTDFGLDTRVNGLCDSACVTVFLAGANRSMTLGSGIGFHPRWWDDGDIAAYYEAEAATRGWETPFDLAEWLYEDTQQEIYLRLSQMVRRGVDPGFAIQTIRIPDGDIWRPSRIVLRAAGVLTE